MRTHSYTRGQKLTTAAWLGSSVLTHSHVDNNFFFLIFSRSVKLVESATCPGFAKRFSDLSRLNYAILRYFVRTVFSTSFQALLPEIDQNQIGAQAHSKVTVLPCFESHYKSSLNQQFHIPVLPAKYPGTESDEQQVSLREAPGQ